MGAIFDNDQQAGSVGVFLGLGLAALGGCMVPLEIFPDTMVKIAHLTPHAWALDGFSELIRRGGNLASVVSELAVLAGFAAVLLALGTWQLRKTLTS
jgi:ABC-2 type transport system permease protein